MPGHLHQIVADMCKSRTNVQLCKNSYLLHTLTGLLVSLNGCIQYAQKFTGQGIDTWIDTGVCEDRLRADLWLPEAHRPWRQLMMCIYCYTVAEIIGVPHCLFILAALT